MKTAEQIFDLAAAEMDAGNPAKGVQLFKKSMEMGYVNAINEVALAYDTGKGVRKDTQKALKLYRRAARLGDWASMANIGTVYRDLGKAHLAKMWFKKALTHGDDYDSAVEIAKLYLIHNNLQNLRKALDYLNLAVKAKVGKTITMHSALEAKQLRKFVIANLRSSQR